MRRRDRGTGRGESETRGHGDAGTRGEAISISGELPLPGGPSLPEKEAMLPLHKGDSILPLPMGEGRGEGAPRRQPNGCPHPNPLPLRWERELDGHQGESEPITQHSALSTQHSEQDSGLRTQDSGLTIQHPAPSTPDSLRVLHIITSLDVGGAQKHLLALVKGLRQRGFVADVAFFKNPSLVSQFAETGARLYDMSTRSTFSPLLLPRLTKLLVAGRYQIVHTHLLKADVYGTLAGVFARTPVRIASKHNDEQVLQRKVVANVHGWISRLNHRIVVLSKYVGRYVSSVGQVNPDSISLVYYGLPLTSATTKEDGLRLRAELGISEDTPLIATVGRLTEQKGLTYLLQAMAILRQRIPEARLLIVGDAQDGRGEYKQQLLQQQQLLRLEDNVVFTGVRNDVPAVMQAIDLFVMASLWEGFGLVFLEAMAAARPIVATNVSAIPEVVEHGVTGILVQPGDPQALADAMHTLLIDRKRAREMGEAGLLRLKNQFTEDNMVDSIAGLYRQLYQGRGRLPN